MRHLLLALVLASSLFSLAGVLFFTRSGGQAGSAGARAVEDLASSLKTELSVMSQRIADLEKRLPGPDGTDSTRPAGRSGPDRTDPTVSDSEDSPEDGAVAEGGSAPGAGRLPATERGRAMVSLSDREADDLRGFVEQVIQDERQEQLEIQAKKMRQEQEELAQLQAGPYGQYNFRVNSLGQRLGLNDEQKQRYHQLVADYSTRLEEMRKGLDRDDPVAYQDYRNRKKLLVDEFEGLVIQSLTPPQVEEYQGLSSREKSPALEHAGAGRVPVAISGMDFLEAPGGGGPGVRIWNANTGGEVQIFDPAMVPQPASGAAPAGTPAEAPPRGATATRAR